MPTVSDTTSDDTIRLWQSLGAKFQHDDHDRCKNYLGNPSYRLPGTVYERTQFAPQFIILHSAEFLRLPPVPDIANLLSALSNQPYVDISAQPDFIAPLPPTSNGVDCLIPTF
jgi:hypothetical protein